MTDVNRERERAALDQIREAYATGLWTFAEMELQTELAIRSNTWTPVWDDSLEREVFVARLVGGQ